jgi:hypothetical protein
MTYPNKLLEFSNKLSQNEINLLNFRIASVSTYGEIGNIIKQGKIRFISINKTLEVNTLNFADLNIEIRVGK